MRWTKYAENRATLQMPTHLVKSRSFFKDWVSEHVLGVENPSDQDQKDLSLNPLKGMKFFYFVFVGFIGFSFGICLGMIFP